MKKRGKNARIFLLTTSRFEGMEFYCLGIKEGVNVSSKILAFELRLYNARKRFDLHTIEANSMIRNENLFVLWEETG